MATAGDGTASYEGGGGGAGGKFRKSSFRRTRATPYDRPPTALRNPNRNGTGGWLSKLIVDPASKLISTGAHMLFSSVFRRRLPPPLALPPPPELNSESGEGHQEAVTNNCSGVKEAAIDGVDNPSNNSDVSGISELEQMLKQKTFTRSEIDRLTELLHSRSVDLPSGHEDNVNGPNPLKTASGYRRHGDCASTPIQENRIESNRLDRITPSPVLSSKVFEEDVASPAELAKAYMHSRHSKASPPVPGLWGPAPKEDATWPNSISFTPRSSIVPLAPKNAARVGISENGFATPRSRGRSAIYSMARSSYPRVHPTSSPKGTATNFGYSGRSSSSLTRFGSENDGLLGSKQTAVKRTSSVLDDDIGSVGPSRRIRQKSNLLSQGSSLSTLGMGDGSDAAQHLTLLTQKPLLMDEARHKISKTVSENENTNIPSTSYASVPSKSSEMAIKILQNLEKLTPKGKSSESKLAASRGKSPIKLTSDMLRGQALRSLEDVDSSNLVQTVQESEKLLHYQNYYLPDAGESASQKQEKDELNGPRFPLPNDTLTSAVTIDTSVIRNDAVPNDKARDSVNTNVVARSPQKKRAFQMSAHEDSLELDDDVHANGPALVADGGEKLETSVVESKAPPSETIGMDKSPTFSEVKTTEDFVLSKRTDMVASDRSMIGEIDTGFTFPASGVPGTTFQPAALSQSASAFDKIVPSKELNAIAPLFSFSSTSDVRLPSSTLSSSSVDVTLGAKSSALSDPNAVGSNSLNNFASGVSDVRLKIHNSSKGDDKDSQKTSDIVGKAGPSSAAVSTSTSGSILSFSAPANHSILNNGHLSSSPIFPSTNPVLDASNFSNQSLANTVTRIAPSTSTATTCTSTVSPSFPSAPIFQFASSTTPAAVSMTSTAEITDLNAKTEKKATSSSLIIPPFGSTSSSVGSTGNNIFAVGSSVGSSTVNNLSQGSLSGSGSGFLVNAQVSPTGSGPAIVSQSMPVQFGSSATSPIFGTSGITSFTASSSVFGSSTPSNNLFGSGTSFGSISSSTSETNSVSTSGDATPSMFSFGLSSSASSSVTNPITSSSGATTSIFSFGPGSSASSTGMGSVSSSSDTTSVFGSSWQPTKSPIFGSTLSSPATGFTFGASSTSVTGSSLSPSIGFSFGASSPSVTTTLLSPSTGYSFSASSTPVTSTTAASMVFGSTSSSSNSLFSFTTTAASASSLPSPSQMHPMFVNSTPAFNATSDNGDQMNMEDSMAEDPVQACTTAVPMFGQAALTAPAAGFMFSSTAPSPAAPFQFGGLPNQATSQNPSPFQASSSVGGSFSLGSGGGDKAARKTVRINRNRNRKK